MQRIYWLRSCFCFNVQTRAMFHELACRPYVSLGCGEDLDAYDELYWIGFKCDETERIFQEI